MRASPKLKKCHLGGQQHIFFFLRYHENNLRTISNDVLRKEMETKFDGKPKFRKFAKNCLPCSIVLVRAKIREWRCHLVILSGKRVTFSYFEERSQISLEMELSGIGAGLHLGNDDDDEEEEEADDADDDNDEDDDEASSLMMMNEDEDEDENGVDEDREGKEDDEMA